MSWIGRLKGYVVTTGAVFLSHADPHETLISFQETLCRGKVQLQRCHHNSDLYLHSDRVNNLPRFIYVTLDQITITSFVSFVISHLIEGIPCLLVGYAVPEPYQNQGRAKKTLNSAIIALKAGFRRAGFSFFYIEAIVDLENVAAQKVAQAVLTKKYQKITDHSSRLPARSYLCKIEIDT